MNEEKCKEQYLDGLEKLISERNEECILKRNEYVKDFFSEQQKKREDFKKMLGFPLTGYKKVGVPNVKSTKINEMEEHSVYRMSFEILDGLWMSGLLFKKNDDNIRPMVIVQHGGLGTPEMISFGDTYNYNHMLERVIQYDVNAFAPQMILWNKELGHPQYDRAEIDARLKRSGSSITAVEVFGIIRIMDWFEKQAYVKNFGMVGLSYGGFYTLFSAAADERIKSAISCSYFFDKTKDGRPDWAWNNASEKFHDAEIACLVYPRRICIEMGINDELFDIKDSQREFERVKMIAESVGTDWIDFISFDGNHEFCKDDMPIKRLADDLISQ